MTLVADAEDKSEKDIELLKRDNNALGVILNDQISALKKTQIAKNQEQDQSLSDFTSTVNSDISALKVKIENLQTKVDKLKTTESTQK